MDIPPWIKGTVAVRFAIFSGGNFMFVKKLLCQREWSDEQKKIMHCLPCFVKHRRWKVQEREMEERLRAMILF
jgi:hypothetical protein